MSRWIDNKGDSYIPEFIPLEEYYEKWHFKYLEFRLFREEEIFIFKEIDGIYMVKLGTQEEKEKLENNKIKGTDFKPSNLCKETLKRKNNEF